MNEITVQQLKEKKDTNASFLLLDVREVFEYSVSNLGGINIPLGHLPSRLDELAGYKNSEIIVSCRSGGRSFQACQFLQKQGFTNVSNLVGGIYRWSEEIDPSLPVV